MKAYQAFAVGTLIAYLKDMKTLMRLSLIQLIWITAGCLSEPALEKGKALGFPGSDLTGRPTVLCGANRGVIGADAAGNVICGTAELKGQIAARPNGAAASCGVNQNLEVSLLSGTSGQLELSLCSDAIASTVDDITLGAPPTDAFACPSGSALKGFSTAGEPICTQLVGLNLIGFPYVMDSSVCPWGLTTGVFQSAEISLSICRLDGPNFLKQIKIIGVKAALFAWQLGVECPAGKMVVGFDANRQIICGALPAHLQAAPLRYVTTTFGMSSEDPICLTGYLPEASYLPMSGNPSRTVKVWTCRKAD